MDTYTMQISGERSYIAGNHDLLEFKDIRRYCSNTLIIAILHWLFLITMIMIIYRYRQTVEQLCKKFINQITLTD